MDFELAVWREDLVPSLAESAADVRVPQYLRDSFPHPYTAEDARAFISFAKGEGEKGDLYRAVVAEGKAVGGITVTRGQDVYRRSAEIGYWLTPAYWGRGIMTEAVRQICLLAYKELDLIRITGLVYEPNIPSRKVLEKNGFVLEGVMKKAVTKGDKVYDLCIYGKCIGE